MGSAGFSCCAVMEPSDSTSFLELLSSHRSSHSGSVTPHYGAEILPTICLSSGHRCATSSFIKTAVSSHSSHNKFGVSVLFSVACKYLKNRQESVEGNMDSSDGGTSAPPEGKSPCGSAVGASRLR